MYILAYSSTIKVTALKKIGVKSFQRSISSKKPLKYDMKRAVFPRLLIYHRENQPDSNPGLLSLYVTLRIFHSAHYIFGTKILAWHLHSILLIANTCILGFDYASIGFTG